MGTLSQVLPYLARRAAENRSVLRGARKERELLQQELRWRLRSMFQRWAVLEMKQKHTYGSWFNLLLFWACCISLLLWRLAVVTLWKHLSPPWITDLAHRLMYLTCIWRLHLDWFLCSVLILKDEYYNSTSKLAITASSHILPDSLFIIMHTSNNKITQLTLMKSDISFDTIQTA
jgi:hypothetical protein